MNREMIHRMKIAGEYQRKAICALFPEEFSGHLDVIENEIKMMMMESVKELMKNCNCEDVGRKTQDSKDMPKTKKVDIM